MRRTTKRERERKREMTNDKYPAPTRDIASAVSGDGMMEGRSISAKGVYYPRPEGC